MTNIGPYNQATLIYQEDENVLRRNIVANPGTILDYVIHSFPAFSHLIVQTHQMKFYNYIDKNLTLFITEKVPSSLLENLSTNLDVAHKILKMSTFPGILTTNMMEDQQKIYTLDNANNLTVSISKFDDNLVSVNNANIVKANIVCKNGIIHVIDEILWPEY